MKRSKPKPDQDQAQDASAGELRECALRLLTRREHSHLELRQKLAARSFPDATIDQVLASLTADGLQSDARFAYSYAQARAGRGYGPVRIRAELRQRGVGDDLIDAQLHQADWDWRRQAEDVRRKRFGRAVPESWPERAKQARFLQYRGFGNEHIQDLLAGGDY